MKRWNDRLIPFVLLAAFIIVAGCQFNQASDKPGGDMNSAMSAQQKALIAEHKKKGEQ